MNWFFGSRLHKLFMGARLHAQRPPGRLGFIVGTGRSGTTILAQLLNSHTHIVVPPELQFFHRLNNCDLKQLRAKDIAYHIEKYCPYHLELFFDYHAYLSTLDYPLHDLAGFLNGFFGAICLHYGKSVLLEKTPWHGQYLPMFATLFPAMHVIHVVRDPRDVVFSFLRTPYWGNISFKNGLLRWEQEVLAIRKYGPILGNHFIEVRYEDMVSAPQECLSRILATLDLDFEETMLDPARLIDYRALLKDARSSLTYQSKEYLEWLEKREQVFFRDNVYCWKRHPDYPSLHGEIRVIKETMALYGYE